MIIPIIIVHKYSNSIVHSHERELNGSKMFRSPLRKFHSILENTRRNSVQVRKLQTDDGKKSLPNQADVVIVGSIRKKWLSFLQFFYRFIYFV